MPAASFFSPLKASVDVMNCLPAKLLLISLFVSLFISCVVQGLVYEAEVV